MKRWGLGGFIVLCILAQAAPALQSSAAAGKRSIHLVVLDDPSVVEQVLEWNPGASPRTLRSALASSQARNHGDLLRRRQRALIERLQQAPSGFALSRTPLEVLEQRTFLLNLLVVRADAEELERLAGIEGVKGIYPNRERLPLLDTAVSLIGAPALWSAVGGPENAGAGVKIGIIDSGIAHDHPMFSGAGMPLLAGFPQGDPSFANNKVIVARNFVLPDYGLREQEVRTPQDESGHGSRVAGIAAGRRVEAPQGIIRGVAPLAHLGNYKVFGSPTVNPTTTTAAVTAAIEQAVADGMDVLNLSLGGPARHPGSDPEQLAIEMAVRLGVVVVVSAGNAGPGPGTVTSPGTSPDAITVGATSNGRIFASVLEIESMGPLPAELERIPYLASATTTVGGALGPLPVQSVAALDATELACSPIGDGTLTGSVALVRRGQCFFTDKAQNVADAGAAAMVVYNNLAGGPIVMGGESFAIPSVMIDLSSGEALRDFLLGGDSAMATLRPDDELGAFATQADIITGFSSWGPNIDLSVKPDLVAPGQNMHTATNQSSPPQYALSANGTSFAAPLVAGAAGVLRQLHSDLADQYSAEEFSRFIKSLLVNTARDVATWDGRPARTIQQGGGRLDLENAQAARAAVHPVSLTFGLIDDDVSLERSRTLTLTNLAGQDQTYTLLLDEKQQNPTVALSVVPGSATLASGESLTVTVSAEFTAPQTGGIFEGRVEVASGNRTVLTIPYWGGSTVEDASVILRVARDGNEAFTDIGDAVAAARPGNVVEIADSGTYTTPLELGFNEAGLSLDGLTLRAAPGQQPTLDLSALASETALRIEGLERVTIEGLRIRGGSAGISLDNSSAFIRSNTIEQIGSSRFDSAIELIASRAHVHDNVISGAGQGISSSSSQALIAGNRIGLTDAGNSGDGIATNSGSLAVFDNQISANGSTASGSHGLELSGSRALIKGNFISDTRGSDAAGVLIRGLRAPVTLVDNEIARNQESGVHLLRDTSATLFRNRIESHSRAGLVLEPGSTGEVRAGVFSSNTTGIEATGATVSLSQSQVVGSSGAGVRAAGGVLTLSSVTAASNGSGGVVLAGGTLAISDSILAGNGPFDISGASPDGLSNNLIADGQFDGSNGNFAADPLFADPGGGDYSLQSGSPALDRGNVLEPFTLLDLNSHERVFDGDGDGSARSDLGSLERGSRFWTPHILPVLASTPQEFVGLALANGFGRSTRVILEAYAPGGQPRGSWEARVASRQQLSLLLSEAFQSLDEGWVRVLSEEPDLMSFALLGRQDQAFLDGTPLAGVISSQLLFPELGAGPSDSVRILLVNPQATAQPVELTWVRDEGSVEVRNLEMAARGTADFQFQDLFGAGAGGWLLARAALPFYGMEIFGSGSARGALLGQDLAAASTRLLGAQLASTPGLETWITLVSPEGATDVTVSAYDEAGRLVASRNLGALAAGARLAGRARDLVDLGGSLVGWLAVGSDQGGLLGNLRFADPGGRFLAALPLETAGAREFVLSHVAQTDEIFTGIALLNAGTDPAIVSLEVFQPGGELTGIVSLELGLNQKIARTLGELLPDLESQQGGFVRVRSNTPIIGFEIFGNAGLDFYAAVPQQVIAR